MNDCDCEFCKKKDKMKTKAQMQIDRRIDECMELDEVYFRTCITRLALDMW